MSPQQLIDCSESSQPRWSRRQCLKTVGTAMVGAAAFEGVRLASTAADLREKAKSNIKLGVDSNVYSSLPLEDAVRRIRDDGFCCVLTNFNFADVRFDPWKPDWNVADKITTCFEKNGVRIAAIFGYYNVVDPDVERRKLGETRMDLLIANWKRLGCPVISTETGTMNRTSEWLDAPENATEESYIQCRAAFERLATAADKTGAIISFEAYWKNIIRSVDRAERILREVPSTALQVVMDPCNYLRKEDLPNMKPMLEDIFRRLGKRIAVAHAKDVKAAAEGTELPAAGKGVLDYPLYLSLLAQLDRPIDLILEHLTLPDVARARDFVRAQMDGLA